MGYSGGSEFSDIHCSYWGETLMGWVETPCKDDLSLIPNCYIAYWSALIKWQELREHADWVYK